MTYEEVKELISIFEDTDLNDMEVTLDGASVRLNRSRINYVQTPGFPAQMPAAFSDTAAQTAAYESANESRPSEDKKNAAAAEEKNRDAEDKKETSRYITCPMVGTFYSSSSPDGKPYVEVGSKVRKGDTVCIIEAMKYMNEVQTDEEGEIAEICVKDGELVEYGQKLFRIE